MIVPRTVPTLDKAPSRPNAFRTRAVEVSVVLDGMASHSRRLVLVTSALLALAAACGLAGEKGPGREGPRLHLLPGLGAILTVSDREIAGLAVGEGAVWVATWNAEAASV
jgi:hypothetical protein